MNDRLTGRSLGLLVIFAIAAYLCWLMLRPFVGVLMWAVVLVVVFFPAHRRLEAWTGSPGSAAALSTLLVIFTILLPVIGVTFAVAHELGAPSIISRVASGTSSICRRCSRRSTGSIDTWTSTRGGRAPTWRIACRRGARTSPARR